MNDHDTKAMTSNRPDTVMVPREATEDCPACFGTGRFQGKYGGPDWPPCPQCRFGKIRVVVAASPLPSPDGDLDVYAIISRHVKAVQHEHFIDRLYVSGIREAAAAILTALQAATAAERARADAAEAANKRLVKALEDAPRPNPTPDPVAYMDWFFKVRIAALSAEGKPSQEKTE